MLCTIEINNLTHFNLTIMDDILKRNLFFFLNLQSLSFKLAGSPLNVGNINKHVKGYHMHLQCKINEAFTQNSRTELHQHTTQTKRSLGAFSQETRQMFSCNLHLNTANNCESSKRKSQLLALLHLFKINISIETFPY